MSWEVCYPGAPVVTGVAPANGSDGVGIQPSLVVTYNEAVYIGSPGDGLEAPHASLSLPPSGPELAFRAEAVVPITDVWALAVRYVPLWHSGVPSLEEWTVYTATVGGAMDAAAQAVTATWTFTTGDFTQPKVVATSPEKDTQVAAPQAVIAYFSEDVSTAGATFTLRGEEPVDGSLAYYNEVPCGEAPSCYQWHFTPYEPLMPGFYTAEVNGVSDRGGNGLEGAYNWSFEVTEGIGIEEEEPGEPARGVEGPAGEGGEIESGMAGVLYVRRTSYYYFVAQRVAMRQVDSWGADNVYYILVDHLGTTSLVLDAEGVKVAESRHWPYGAERWSWSADGSGALPTDYRFTGQRDGG